MTLDEGRREEFTFDVCRDRWKRNIFFYNKEGYTRLSDSVLLVNGWNIFYGGGGRRCEVFGHGLVREFEGEDAGYHLLVDGISSDLKKGRVWSWFKKIASGSDAI